MMKPVLPILCLLIGASSCTSDFDFGIDTSPKPVVNCLFHPDSSWKIELTNSPESMWNYQFKPVMGATVRIIRSNQVPVVMDQFISEDPGFYTSSIVRVPSAPYETINLEIIDMQDTVTAASYIPPRPVFTATVSDLVATRDDHYSHNGRFDWVLDGKIHLGIDTRSNGHNWYAIRLRYRNSMIYGGPDRMDANDPDTSITDHLSLDFSYPGAFQTLRKTDGYCIDLSTYNPETDDLVLTIRGSVNNLPADLDYIVLTVTSITEEFFIYNKKVIAQYVASQDLFSEPVTIPGNITGGLGIFSGVHSVTDTILIAPLQL
jgi:hypothetical protein